MLTHLPLQNIPQQSATEQAHQNDIKGNCKSQESNFALIQDKENSQVKPLGTEKVKYIYIYHLPFLACSPKTGCCLYVKEQSDTNYNTLFSPNWQYKIL